MSWFLSINGGAPRSFSSLGCVGLRRQARSQTPGEFRFRLNLQTIETAPICAVNDLAQVRWTDMDGMDIIFSGRVYQIPLAGAAAREDHEYVIRDAWHDFEQIIYQVQWNRITIDEKGNPNTAGQYSSTVNLGVDSNGNSRSSGQVIQDAVNWAVARGANCQLGNIMAGDAAAYDTPIPVDEARDLPVAEVIKKMIRWTPDAVAWFDFSTTPPTFNITRQAQLNSVTLPFADMGDAVNITSRQDLVRPQVLLRYEQSNVSDGNTYTEVIIDAAGQATPGAGVVDGLMLGAFVATIELAGAQATFQKQPITTTAIPTSASSDSAVPFIFQNTPWLNKFSQDRIQVNAFSAEILSGQKDDQGDPIDDLDQSDYPNQLLTGTMARWMQSAYPNLKTANALIYSNITYLFPSGDQDTEAQLAAKYFTGGSGNAVEVDFSLVATNAITQTYQFLSDYTRAEAAPTGLAAALYGALGTLQYEGAWNVIQEEVSAITNLGIALNLTGGAPEWETMNAIVQEIEDDLDNGITTFKFGPAKHLGIQDLMEQIRATRKRAKSSRIQAQQTGKPEYAFVNGAGFTPNTVAASPPGSGAIPPPSDTTQAYAFLWPPNGSAGAWSGPGSGKTLGWQSVAVCVSGVQKTMLVLGTAPA